MSHVISYLPNRDNLTMTCYLAKLSGFLEKCFENLGEYCYLILIFSDFYNKTLISQVNFILHRIRLQQLNLAWHGVVCHPNPNAGMFINIDHVICCSKNRGAGNLNSNWFSREDSAKIISQWIDKHHRVGDRIVDIPIDKSNLKNSFQRLGWVIK